MQYDRTSTEVLSNKTILVIFLLYTLSFSLLIPAYPKLLLNLTNNQSGLSSIIYGIASSTRYFLEFFSSQYLGILSDRVGRKPVLILALVGIFFEFLLLAMYPCITTIIISKVLSGIFDVTLALAHAIVTDIACNNNESVTQHFGTLAAVLGFGFVFGPIMGSLIASYSIPLCFAISSIIAGIAAIITHVAFEETNLVLTQSSISILKLNPFLGLKIFFANRHLKRLCIPYLFVHGSHGVYFIWILYMTYRFHSTIIETGLFLSSSGLCAVLVQGILIRYVVPDIWSDRFTSLFCIICTGIQYSVYGLANNIGEFYLVLLLFSFTSMYGPAIQSLIVDRSSLQDQGSIQGSLGSLRMIISFCSSIFFPAVFAISINFRNQSYPGVVFYISGFMCLCAAISLRSYLMFEESYEGMIRYNEYDELADSEAAERTQIITSISDKSIRRPSVTAQLIHRPPHNPIATFDDQMDLQ